MHPVTVQGGGSGEGPPRARRVWATVASHWLCCCWVRRKPPSCCEQEEGAEGEPPRGPASCEQVFLHSLLLSHFEMKPNALCSVRLPFFATVGAIKCHLPWFTVYPPIVMRQWSRRLR